MIKQLLKLFISLLASACVKVSADEQCYRHPVHQKQYAQSVVSSGQQKFPHMQEVYIDWQRLYWGDLKELLEPEDETSDIQEIAQVITRELRQQLKSFAKDYSLQIVWHPSPGCPDITAEFLEYWDHSEQANFLSIAALSSLAVQSSRANT